VQPFSDDPTLTIECGSIAYNMRSGPGTENVHFVWVPPGFTGGSQEEWAIREVPDCPRDQVVDEGKSVLTRSYEMIIAVFNRRIGRSEFTRCG